MIFILALVASACSSFDDECGNYSYANIEGYEVEGDVFTPEGIHVDAEKGYNLSLLDQITNEVYSCLSTAFSDSELSPAVFSEAGCFKKEIRFVKKSCLEVKIPNDWTLSCDGSQQLLKDKAPEESCIAKGLSEDSVECSCAWRAGIQQKDDSRPIIVTTPSLYLYKDPLLRYITSCDYPWSSPILAECMTPTTGPLDTNLLGETNEL